MYLAGKRYKKIMRWLREGRRLTAIANVTGVHKVTLCRLRKAYFKPMSKADIEEEMGLTWDQIRDLFIYSSVVANDDFWAKNNMDFIIQRWAMYHLRREGFSANDLYCFTPEKLQERVIKLLKSGANRIECKWALGRRVGYVYLRRASEHLTND